MPSENALSMLRATAARRPLSPVIAIAGPHAFLREYLTGAIVKRLVAEGFQHRSAQIANTSDAIEFAEEVGGGDLFAPRRVFVCRMMRSFRERAGEEEAAGEGDRKSGGDGAILDVITEYRGPGHLVFVYDREQAPAKIRRAVESEGTLVNCMRPFDNQLAQYAQAFARGAGLEIGPDAAETLAARHGGDLSAMANALAKLAISLEPGAKVKPSDLNEAATSKIPEPFEIAEAVSQGRVADALQKLERALASGRDPVEILSVELIPVVRRMVLAASMIASKRPTAEVAAAFGMNPMSPLVTRAIEGARRFGLPRLTRSFARVGEMDAKFKNGEIKDRAGALSAFVLELTAE
ncbi:MAG TPA: hypothetical protein VEF03_12050 [Candidatus Binataceae bacterium]|nr:hypothetical protein [Candidatus Binataceae bacterium]